MNKEQNYKLDTLCVQAGYTPKTGESRIPQICQSTTFYYGSTKAMADCFDLKSDGYFYSRLSNPTLVALENKMAALEGGVCGIACSSGMSATLLAALGNQNGNDEQAVDAAVEDWPEPVDTGIIDRVLAEGDDAVAPQAAGERGER